MLWVTPLARDQVKALWGKVDMYIQHADTRNTILCPNSDLDYVLNQMMDGAKVYLTPHIEDESDHIVENLKQTLFDSDNHPINGFPYTFKTWCGDSHSFIIEDDGDEYRVIVQKEPKE